MTNHPLTPEQDDRLRTIREEARGLGYMLVHRDRVRTATVSSRVPKMDLRMVSKMQEADLRRFVETALYRQLSDFLVKESMVDVQELPHEWDVEFRLDLQVLGPKTPHPDTSEHFIYRPLDWKERP